MKKNRIIDDEEFENVEIFSNPLITPYSGPPLEVFLLIIAFLLVILLFIQ